MARNMADEDSSVEIGYLEKREKWKLDSRFFPSKVGGKPSWLDLRHISCDLKCGRCAKPTILLCQIYAPIDDREDCHHRTLFVFMCLDPDCQSNDSSNFKVFRCQIPQKNEFYEDCLNPTVDPSWCPDIVVEKFSKVCVVCGALGPHRCSKCTSVNYCSKEHQVLHWKNGHKLKCGVDPEYISDSILFPEFEIMIEPEEENDDDQVESVECKTENQRMEEYEKLVADGKGGTLEDVPAELMEQLALGKEDKYMKQFKRKLALCPDQVIRYDRGKTPLYISEPGNFVIPNCEHCNGERSFEFQILPTMLNYLNVDTVEKSIDWGNLVIFTCHASCNEGPAYKSEHLKKFDIV